jgi:hypothetical protein
VVLSAATGVFGSGVHSVVTEDDSAAAKHGVDQLGGERCWGAGVLGCCVAPLLPAGYQSGL